MNISYSRPFLLGWTRMKKALFQPFDITKWFNLLHRTFANCNTLYRSSNFAAGQFTFRAFSLEFLKQFDEEFNVFPKLELEES